MNFTPSRASLVICVCLVLSAAVTANASCLAPQWNVVAGSPTGVTTASQVEVGDFHGDKHADVFALTPQRLSVVPGSGAGTIPFNGSYVSAETNANFTGMVVRDVDGDGLSDVVVADSGLGRILFFQGNIDVALTPSITGAPFLPRTIAAADFDSDGKVDLVVTAGDSANVIVLSGDASGHFSEKARTAIAATPVARIVVGDIDGDGHADVAVSYSGSSTIDVLFGRGDGTLAPPVPITVGRYPGANLSLSDVDHDGRADLIAVNSDDLTVTINRSSGRTFSAAEIHSIARANLAYAQTPRALLVEDVTEDGNPDIVVADGVLSELAVLPGRGDGTFAEAVLTSVRGQADTSPSALALADFDEDGVSDLAMYDSAGTQLALALNRCGKSSVTAVPVYPVVSVSQSSLVNVTVAGGSPGVPTGTVTVSQDGADLATAVLVAGKAQLEVPALSTPFIHTLTVTYSGDQAFNHSTTTYKQNVTQDSSSVTLTFSPLQQKYGVNDSVTANVTTSRSDTPTGTVTFVIDGVTQARLSLWNGSVTMTLRQSPGNHTITAEYSGDSTHPRASTYAAYDVVKGTPQFGFSSTWRDVSTAGTTLSNSLYFSTNSYAASPSGKMRFTIDGRVAADLSAGQSYPISLQLPLGIHYFEVDYPGDANYQPAHTLNTHRVFSAGTFALDATTVYYTSIKIVWTPFSGASAYRVSRSDPLTGPIGAVFWEFPAGTTSYWDGSPKGRGPYVYYAEALDSARNVLARSNSDLTLYGAPSIVIPGSTIKADDFYLALSQINAVRSALSLTAVGWPGSLRQQPIRATTLQDMRKWLNEALAKAGIPAVTYSAPVVIPGSTIIRAADIEEINQATR